MPETIDWFDIVLYDWATCPICGDKDSWRVLANPIDRNPQRVILGATWPDGDPIESYGLAVVVISCSTCGYIWLRRADDTKLAADQGFVDTSGPE